MEIMHPCHVSDIIYIQKIDTAVQGHRRENVYLYKERLASTSGERKTHTHKTHTPHFIYTHMDIIQLHLPLLKANTNSPSPSSAAWPPPPPFLSPPRAPSPPPAAPSSPRRSCSWPPAPLSWRRRRAPSSPSQPP